MIPKHEELFSSQNIMIIILYEIILDENLYSVISELAILVINCDSMLYNNF